MQAKQKNWVFLACMLIVALFSVVVVFRNVKYMGRAPGLNPTTLNVQEIMAEIEASNKILETSVKSGAGNRPELYARASKVAALLDELIKETPDNPTVERIGDWDRRTTKSVHAANRLADLAGDTGADWSKVVAVNRALQQSCVECHDQFHKDSR